MKIHRMASKQKGIAALEFVIMSPLLIIFIGICAEIGNVFVDYQLLNKAVRTGSRFAVTDTYGTTGAALANPDSVKNVVVYGFDGTTGSAVLEGLTTDSVTITSTGNTVTVSATYAYQPIFTTLPFIGVSTNINLTASSVMEAR